MKRAFVALLVLSLALPAYAAITVTASTGALTISSGLPNTTNFTLIFWAQVHDTGGYGDFASFGRNDVGSARFVQKWDSTRIHANYDPNVGNVTGSTLSTATWYRFAITLDGSGVPRLYLNDALDITGTGSGTPDRFKFFAQPWYPGNDYPPNLGPAKAWNALLTLAEIVNEGKSIRAKRRDSIYAEWHHLSSGDVTDYSGKGNNWTVTGTLSTAGTNPPIPWN